MTNGIELMLPYADFINKINRKVFRGGLRINALENPQDISTIVGIEDKAISRIFLIEGIDGHQGVQYERPGSSSEEMDSPERVNALEIDELDPIDGTGDLKKSTGMEPENVEFRKLHNITAPYGATNLVSRLRRNSTRKLFAPVAGMIFDFIDEMVLLGDEEDVGLYRVDGEKLVQIPYSVRQSRYRSGEPIRIGRRDAYPHHAFEEFLKFLRDEKKLDLIVVRIGGAGRAAEQLFRTNMVPDTDNILADYKDTAIDVFFNYQPDHKTWDLDPILAMHRALGVTKPTTVYGTPLNANAAVPPYTPSGNKRSMFNPGGWHSYGYLYSARGPDLHQLMAKAAREFEQAIGHKYRVLDKKIPA